MASIKRKNKISIYNKKLLKLHNKVIKDFIDNILINHNINKRIVNIVFVSKVEIKLLNNRYRKKSKITDVITFSMVEDEYSEFSGNMLGDIYICEEYIGKNDKEIFTRIIHGIMHLLGYDHVKDKKQYEYFVTKQEKYVEQFYRQIENAH